MPAVAGFVFMAAYDTAAAAASAAAIYSLDGGSFTQPPVITSAAGQLNVTLDLGMVDYVGPIHSLRTRALGGRIPGPTLRIRAGDTLRVRFRNRLRFQRSADGPERPDVSNLHFHGLHTGSALPGDDTTLPVGPRAEYTYVIEIPPDHAPGTFWIHPHVHGSSTLQGGGGAMATLIVDDPPGSLPAPVATARELVWVVQHFATDVLFNVGKMSGDERFVVGTGTFNYGSDPEEDEGGVDGSAMREDFTLVNGMFEPVLTVAPGEWTRWRLIYPGQQAHPAQALDLAVAAPNIGCEMQLLAKDGIYLADAPRQISQARVPAGGRADVMVRCSTAGTADVTSEGRLIARLHVAGAAQTSDLLPAWSPPRPPYLADLGAEAVDERCRCSTRMGECKDELRLSGERCINGLPWLVTEYLHVAPLGVVQERTLGGLHRHPYHHHMFPFQLTSGFNDSEYFRRGDWHDTWQDAQLPADAAPAIRFRPLDFTGRMLLHCHWLQHQDDGMMASEHVTNGTNAATGLPSGAEGCACEAFTPAPAEHPELQPPNTLCGRVECYDGADDDMTSLVYYQWGLSGTIPTQIGRFTNVRYLGLGENQLSGTVPTELALLSDGLTTALHLWRNRLSGTLPTELGRLTPYTCNLLDGSLWPAFDGNHFSCPLPALGGSCGASAACTNVTSLPAPPPAPSPSSPRPSPPPAYPWFLPQRPPPPPCNPLSPLPTPIAPPSSPPLPDDRAGLSAGALAGICISGMVAGGFLVGGVLLCVRRSRSTSKHDAAQAARCSPTAGVEL